MFIPFYNFHALKFNPNTVLLPTWAGTTFWFLRSYKTRGVIYSALAGIGAGACMLGKYWSVFLLAGLIVAALGDRRRWLYLRSTAPWVTLVVGCAVLVPHLIWLSQHDFAPFEYAIAKHVAHSFTDIAVNAFTYLAGTARSQNNRGHDLAGRRGAPTRRHCVLDTVVAPDRRRIG